MIQGRQAFFRLCRHLTCRNASFLMRRCTVEMRFARGQRTLHFQCHLRHSHVFKSTARCKLPYVVRIISFSETISCTHEKAHSTHFFTQEVVCGIETMQKLCLDIMPYVHDSPRPYLTCPISIDNAQYLLTGLPGGAGINLLTSALLPTTLPWERG